MICSKPVRLFALLVCFVAGIGRAAWGNVVGAPIRVVSQTVGTDELLLALADHTQVGALSQLADDPAFSAVAEEARAFPRLVAGGDAESILKYSPTLVLFADYSRAELVEQIRRAHVHVIIFDHYSSLDDAYANLRILARGLNAQARAEKLIAECQARVASLALKLRGTQPVRVISPSIYGVIPGDETTFQDLCDHAGAINLAKSIGRLRGHAAPPGEQLLNWPIDRVVVGGTSLKTALAPYQELPPYSLLPAVREGRAVLLEPYQLGCVSYRRIDGYERLARALHPEAFR